MSLTEPRILRQNSAAEFFTEEGCFILESSNIPEDPAVSIARARVAPGATTRWHRLNNTAERYLIRSGEGVVEVGDLPPARVGPGDVVLIPARTRQRIRNTGAEDLVFYCVCSPRFSAEDYEDLE
jgi:mannose-6-phosphate isomerase-like protein (cupin superfamily)